MYAYQKSCLIFLLLIFSAFSFSMDLSLDANEYIQEQTFHERYKRAYSNRLHDEVQAYYKKITPITSTPTAGRDQWYFSSATIADNYVRPDANGVYTYGDISFTINPPVDFDPTQDLYITVRHKDNLNNIRFVKHSEEKVPAFSRFASYQDLVDAASNNNIALSYEVILEGILRVPGELAYRILIEGENRCLKPIIVRGMEIMCDKAEKVTKIFLDFSDHLNESVNYFIPIEYEHSCVTGDKTVFCIKEHKVYECNGKSIYGLFPSREIRTKWIPVETGFYDQNRQVLTSLPGCYSDNSCNETLKQPIISVFEVGHNSFYQLDSAENPKDTHEYLYGEEGSFFGTLSYEAHFKEYLSDNKITLHYLVQVLKPHFVIDKNVIIEGGHCTWPTGIYERVCEDDRATGCQRIGRAGADPIYSKKIPLTVVGLDEDLNKTQNKQWYNAPQRVFLCLPPKIYHYSKDIEGGFKRWCKLHNLELNNPPLERSLALLPFEYNPTSDNSSLFNMIPDEIWRCIFLTLNKNIVIEALMPTEEKASAKWCAMQNIVKLSLVCKKFNSVAWQRFSIAGRTYRLLPDHVNEIKGYIACLGGKEKAAYTAFTNLNSGCARRHWWFSVTQICKAMKADLNTTRYTGAKGETLLTQAILKKDTYLISMLLKGGADPKQKNQSGAMPIDLAYNHGLFDYAILIKNYGGDPDNKYGSDAGKVFCRQGQYDSLLHEEDQKISCDQSRSDQALLNSFGKQRFMHVFMVGIIVGMAMGWLYIKLQPSNKKEDHKGFNTLANEENNTAPKIELCSPC